MYFYTHLALEKDVYIINTADFQGDISRFFSLLSPQEQGKANAFVLEYLKSRYVIAHGILRILLSQYLKIHPKKITFDYSIYGKPFCPDESSFHFNMSHSEEYVAYIFSYQDEVGIDIEFMQKDIDVDLLVTHALSPPEIRLFQKMDLKQKRIFFYNIWTLKESFVKAIGTGLSYPLASLETFLDPERGPGLKVTMEGHPYSSDSISWTFASLEIPPGYCCALAIHQKDCSFKIQKLDTNELLP